MRTRFFALLAGLLIFPVPRDLLLQAQTPGGSFVKAPTSINFKEALAFPEISLLLRGGMAQAEIVQEIHQRGLVRPVTAEEVKLLQEKGASPALLEALQDLRFVLTPAEFDNYLQRQARKQSDLETMRLSTPTPLLRNFPTRAPGQPAPFSTPLPAPKPVEIEVPLEEFTVIKVNGHDLHIFIQDNGDFSITLKVENQRPAKFPKADGLDSQNTNLTPLFAVDGQKVSFVNTPRAHMNKCILRIEPK